MVQKCGLMTGLLIVISALLAITPNSAAPCVLAEGGIGGGGGVCCLALDRVVGIELLVGDPADPIPGLFEGLIVGFEDIGATFTATATTDPNFDWTVSHLTNGLDDSRRRPAESLAYHRTNGFGQNTWEELADLEARARNRPGEVRRTP